MGAARNVCRAATESGVTLVVRRRVRIVSNAHDSAWDGGRVPDIKMVELTLLLRPLARFPKGVHNFGGA